MNAILDHTTDSYLVYADWLEERGLDSDSTSWRMPVAVQLPIVKFKNGFGYGYGSGYGSG